MFTSGARSSQALFCTWISQMGWEWGYFGRLEPVMRPYNTQTLCKPPGTATEAPKEAGTGLSL